MGNEDGPLELACEECGVRVAFSVLDKHLRQHRAYLAYSCGDCRCRFFVFPDAQAHFLVGKIHAPGTPANIIEELDSAREKEIEAILKRAKEAEGRDDASFSGDSGDASLTAPPQDVLVKAYTWVDDHDDEVIAAGACPPVVKNETESVVVKTESKTRSGRVLRPRTVDLEKVTKTRPCRGRRLRGYCLICEADIEGRAWRQHLLSTHMRRASFRCRSCDYGVACQWYPSQTFLLNHAKIHHPGQVPDFEDLREELMGELGDWESRCFALPGQAES